MPLHIWRTCAHHQEVKIVLYTLWYRHTCRWLSGAQVQRNLILEYFSKICRKNQVSLTSDKNSGFSTWRPEYILILSPLFLLRMRNVSYKGCRENQNVHFMFSNSFFRKSCRLWDNVEKCCRVGHDTFKNIWRMRIACWIPESTHTHTHTQNM